jgi:hypothetical protein
MSDEFDPGIYDDDDPILEVDGDTLEVIQGIVRIVEGFDWYRSVGGVLEPQVWSDADAYLIALGFPDLVVAAVPEGPDLEEALAERDWVTDWSSAEDQLRSAIAEDAMNAVGEEAVTAAVAIVGRRAHGPALTTAQHNPQFQSPVRDWAEQAANDARDAACQALLVALAEAGTDHPLALKFRLYEAGHWPLGAVGGSFNVF